MRRLPIFLLAGHFLMAWAIAQDVPIYPGSEPTAEWRQQAEDKIGELRKGGLVVLVLDAENSPVKDAAVTVRQQRHAFPFSIVVDPAMFGEAAEEKNARAYRDRVAALFGQVQLPPETDAPAAESVRQWTLGLGLTGAGTDDKLTEVTFTPDPAQLAAPAEAIAQLAPEAASGTPLRLSGFAFPVDPADPARLQLQAFYTRDLLTAAFADSRFAGIGLTGLWAGDASPPPGWILYNQDWSPRPVAEMLQQLLRKTWWTEDGGLTSANGEWAGRVFLGEYRVSVAEGGRTRTVSASVIEPHTIVEIKLGDEPAPAPSAPPATPPD